MGEVRTTCSFPLLKPYVLMHCELGCLACLPVLIFLDFFLILLLTSWRNLSLELRNSYFSLMAMRGLEKRKGVICYLPSNIGTEINKQLLSPFYFSPFSSLTSSSSASSLILPLVLPLDKSWVAIWVPKFLLLFSLVLWCRQSWLDMSKASTNVAVLDDSVCAFSVLYL